MLDELVQACVNNAVDHESNGNEPIILIKYL